MYLQKDIKLSREEGFEALRFRIEKCGSHKFEDFKAAFGKHLEEKERGKKDEGRNNQR